MHGKFGLLSPGKASSHSTALPIFVCPVCSVFLCAGQDSNLWSWNPLDLSHSESLRIGQNAIMFSDSARNLGVMFDKTLSMKGQAGRVSQGADFELRRLGPVRQYLSIDATKPLVTSLALVLSRLDYCNSPLAGTPQILIDKSR